MKQHAKVIPSSKQKSKLVFGSNRIKKFYKSDKLSKFICAVKTCTRFVKPIKNEPVLLQVKYFDGRPPLVDLNAQKSLQLNRILSHFQNTMVT